MANAQQILRGILYLVIIASVPLTEGVVHCTYNDNFWIRSYTCADYQYCCERYSSGSCCGTASSAVGVIVGICIGSLFALGLLIACICVCVQKSKARPGHVVAPTQPVAFVTTTGQTHMQSYPPPGQGNLYGQQPGFSNNYSGQPGVPPPYNPDTPAYPPPKV
ncbi:hypothetical protein ACF0H5_017207 [Mactra antiquata]